MFIRTLKFAAGLALFFCAIPIHAQIVPNRYTVILEDPPLAARFATRDDLNSAAAATYRQQIESRQAQLVRDLESRNFRVTGSVSTLLNAVFVTAPASRVAELESLPGVAAVRPMRRHKPALNAAVANINAPAAWSTLGGQSNAGAGIKIGIIDSGIDQTHPAFQDPSLPMPGGFPICTTGHPEDCAYTTNKVIVARSYVRQLALEYVTSASNPAPESQPDDYSPRDHLGHGTAVASCAAAFTASGPATASAGGSVTITGVAPKAYLGNYKIVGSPGINDSAPDDVLIQAVEDAVKDGMDVVNMSFGSIALSDAASDPLAAAYEAAAQKIVVVLPSGNDGNATFFQNENYPYFGSLSTPGTAPSAITVGATMNSHVFNTTVSAAASGAASSLKHIAALPGDSYQTFFGASLVGGATAPLVDVTKLGDNGLACSALPASSLTGAYALIERGTCSFDQKAINAQTAGAIGVVFYMADSSALLAPGSISSDFIGPTVMISNADGAALKNYIDANPGQAVTIDMSGAEQALSAFSSENGFTPPLAVNQLASYSSVGPTPDGNLKPELVTIGGADPDYPTNSGLYMPTQSLDPTPQYGGATLYSTTRYAAADGTSFSSPVVAGAAALVKQAHPSFSPAQIKSLLVNSAAQDATVDDFGSPLDPEWIGAGRLDAGAAASAKVSASPAVVSFGIYQAGGSLPSAKTITLTNSGSSAVTLTSAVAASANSTAASPSVTVTPQSLTLPAGGSGTLTVGLTGSTPTSSGGKYTGMITLSGSGTTLRIPYLFLAGTGVAYNVNPIYSSVAGYPGQDAGSFVVQVVDANGVPVAGAPVSFTAATSGAVTLKSYGFGEPACSPASSSAAVSCPTDKFGVAYVEVILGSQTGDTTVNAKVAGLTFPMDAFAGPQPTVSQGQVLNGATFQTPIAPGSYAAIFGSNLLDTSNLSGYAFYNNLTYDLATTANLPLTLDYTSVTFDVPSAGISLPGYVYFVSPGQVNVWVPWELEGQSSVQMKVNVDEYSWGNVVTVPLANYAPGFFLNSTDVADALDSNYNLITSANPAVRGQTIQLYCNGLGPVSNAPADGVPASASPLSQTTTTPVVTIGGQSAQVVFSGLAPGFVGLYQLNVTVPAGIGTGNQPVTISIGGAASPSKTAGSSPQTIVIPVK